MRIHLLQTFVSQGKMRFAIVTFINDAIAAKLLYRSENQSEFILDGKSLNIQRHTKRNLVQSSINTASALFETFTSCTIKVADVRYGNVISAAALKSLSQSSSTTNDQSSKIGIIGHVLTLSSSWTLTIDHQKKRIRFIASTGIPWTFDETVTNQLVIEWDFQE